MLTRRHAFKLFCLVPVLFAAGCTHAPPSPRADYQKLLASPGLQVARVDPSLKGRRYSVLLDFELPSDDAFAAAKDSVVALDSTRAATGKSSLRVDGRGPHRVELKLDSLLSGRRFPDQWTLIGVSIYSERTSLVTAGLGGADATSGRHRAYLNGGEWTTLWLDVSNLHSSAAGNLALNFETGGTVWLDDLLVTDNDYWYVGENAAAQPWSIHRRGYQITVQSPQRFKVALDTILAKPEGFVTEEITPLRARFASVGDVKSLTIFRDGRSYWDGEFRPLGAAAASHADESQSAARIALSPEMGRLDRASAGDMNNDGFNESRGAYQVVAAAPRVDISIAPAAGALLAPVIEITGVPAKSALVTVDGRLVNDVVITPSGAVLIVLPLRLEKPATLSVRID